MLQLGRGVAAGRGRHVRPPHRIPARPGLEGGEAQQLREGRGVGVHHGPQGGVGVGIGVSVRVGVDVGVGVGRNLLGADADALQLPL